MKNSGLLIVGVIAVIIALASMTANAAPAASSLDLSGLAANFAVSLTDENRLNALYAAMLDNGVTQLQANFMLSQILWETGMLTDQANERLMSQNNFAGLTTISGAYAAYSSIDDFMTAYLGFLTKGSNPLGASNLADFNNRLQQNGYYTEDPAVYLNGLMTYYTLLS